MGEAGCLYDVSERIMVNFGIVQLARNLRSNNRTQRSTYRRDLDTVSQSRMNVIIVG